MAEHGGDRAEATVVGTPTGGHHRGHLELVDIGSNPLEYGVVGGREGVQVLADGDTPVMHYLAVLPER